MMHKSDLGMKLFLPPFAAKLWLKGIHTAGMTKMRKAGFSLQAGMSLQQAPIKCKLKG